MICHVRWIVRRDLLEVLAIEANSFEWDWNEEDFLRCLRLRNCIGMVAEYKENIYGYMLYELHKSKLHFIKMAVHPEHRRGNIGTQMVKKVITKLSSHRRNRLTVEVRESNLEAQLFFRRQGFQAVKILPDFFEDSGESAYVMEYRLEEEVPSNRVSVYMENE